MRRYEHMMGLANSLSLAVIVLLEAHGSIAALGDFQLNADVSVRIMGGAGIGFRTRHEEFVPISLASPALIMALLNRADEFVEHIRLELLPVGSGVEALEREVGHAVAEIYALRP